MLLIPTAYWVHLKLPRLRPVIEFLTILPFVVPPIVLVVGLLPRVFKWTPTWFYGGILSSSSSDTACSPSHTSIGRSTRDSAAIDIHTLTEAAQSLGATMDDDPCSRVILPNLRLERALGDSFLTLALRDGRVHDGAATAAPDVSLVDIAYIGQVEATGAAALSLISFAITWFAMLGVVARRTPSRWPSGLQARRHQY